MSLLASCQRRSLLYRYYRRRQEHEQVQLVLELVHLLQVKQQLQEQEQVQEQEQEPPWSQMRTLPSRGLLQLLRMQVWLQQRQFQT